MGNIKQRVWKYSPINRLSKIKRNKCGTMKKASNVKTCFSLPPAVLKKMKIAEQETQLKRSKIAELALDDFFKRLKIKTKEEELGENIT